jgi:hypothetical protein
LPCPSLVVVPILSHGTFPMTESPVSSAQSFTKLTIDVHRSTVWIALLTLFSAQFCGRTLVFRTAVEGMVVFARYQSSGRPPRHDERVSLVYVVSCERKTSIFFDRSNRYHDLCFRAFTSHVEAPASRYIGDFTRLPIYHVLRNVNPYPHVLFPRKSRYFRRPFFCPEWCGLPEQFITKASSSHFGCKHYPTVTPLSPPHLLLIGSNPISLSSPTARNVAIKLASFTQARRLAWAGKQ